MVDERKPMTENDKYGPWIAFNGGPKPIAGNVKVQVQLRGITQEQAEKNAALTGWDWDVPRGYNHAITNYRILYEPETVTLWARYNRGELSEATKRKAYDNDLRITFQTIDGKPDWSTVKIEENAK